jgi:siroheme synthase-like protein
VAHAYPLLLDVTNRLIVIVGGGAVAVRKARGVLDAGATRVRCVAPAFHAEMPEKVERIAEEFAARHLDGAGLVFAATDCPAVNDSVLCACRARGVLVSRADGHEHEPGDFVTPARFVEGAVIVAISAGSAALSASLRDSLVKVLDRRYVQMAEAMKSLRPAIRALPNLEPARRSAIFRDLAQQEALATLQSSGINGLREWIESRFPEISHG